MHFSFSYGKWTGRSRRSNSCSESCKFHSKKLLKRYNYINKYWNCNISATIREETRDSTHSTDNTHSMFNFIHCTFLNNFSEVFPEQFGFRKQITVENAVFPLNGNTVTVLNQWKQIEDIFVIWTTHLTVSTTKFSQVKRSIVTHVE